MRYVPIHEDDGVKVNYADCAFFSLQEKDSNLNSIVSLTESFKQIGESYTAPLPFATASEIDNLLTTNPMIYSSGRSTGPKGGISCPVRISGVNIDSVTSYKRQGVYISCYFSDLIEFVKPVNDPDIGTICAYPVRGGDSGSALIADFDGVRKIIGLVYAGGEVSGVTYYGYACRIDRVASELGIEAWNGTNKAYINPATIQYKTTPNGSSTKILSCGGKQYWQVGLTTLSNPC